jgi:predicted ATPase
MIKNLYLKYFKCFHELALPLGNLTLLTGFNAAGKSSILQSLLLLHQNMIRNQFGKEVLLNGNYINLGTASEVIDEINGKNNVTIGFKNEIFKLEWLFKAQDRMDVKLEVAEIFLTRDNKTEELLSKYGDKNRISNLIPLADPELFKALYIATVPIITLKYLSAERMGPRELYPLNTSGSDMTLGIHGEYAPWFLYDNQDKNVSESLLIPGYPPTLIRQCEAWLNFFFPNTNFQISRVQFTNMVSLGVQTSKALNFHRPPNVGFGITQVFPIVVACLYSRPGDILLIENPESHLHPSGQSLMGYFLAKCASTGLQIITESHSDHILNGIRRATKDKVLSPQLSAIHFFNKRHENSKISQITSPQIDAKGNLDFWPEGFFDQFDKDMEYFLELGH